MPDVVWDRRGNLRDLGVEGRCPTCPALPIKMRPTLATAPSRDHEFQGRKDVGGDKKAMDLCNNKGTNCAV